MRCVCDSVRFECEVCQLQCTVRKCFVSLTVYSSRLICVRGNIEGEGDVCQLRCTVLGRFVSDSVRCDGDLCQ